MTIVGCMFGRTMGALVPPCAEPVKDALSVPLANGAEMPPKAVPLNVLIDNVLGSLLPAVLAVLAFSVMLVTLPETEPAGV
jgi:hypothetical protein